MSSAKSTEKHLTSQIETKPESYLQRLGSAWKKKKRKGEMVITFLFLLTAVAAALWKGMEWGGHEPEVKAQLVVIFVILEALLIHFCIERLTVTERTQEELTSIQEELTSIKTDIKSSKTLTERTQEELTSIKADIETFKSMDQTTHEYIEKVLGQPGKDSFLEILIKSSPDVRRRTKQFALYHQSLKNLQDDKAFEAISNRIIQRHQYILERMAAGRINVPIGLAIDLQRTIMDQFHNRMDAASYRDLDFWSSIFLGKKLSEGGFDAGFGSEYYKVILERHFGEHRTVVTRIFVLDRNELFVPERKTLLAEIINQHMEDKIGVAVVFTNNFGNALENLLNEDQDQEDSVKKDFALFDKNEVATFFRGYENRRFEAIFKGTGKAAQIQRQREIHSTFLTISVLATQDFEEQVKGCYSEQEWSYIREYIKNFRTGRSHLPSDNAFDSDFFSVIIRNDDDDDKRLSDIVAALTKAIKISERFGSVGSVMHLPTG